MKKEAVTNGKLNGTHSKSVIITSPDGKQVTSQHTSVYTTRSTANGPLARHANSEPEITRSKSTSPTRRQISPPRTSEKMTSESNRNIAAESCSASPAHHSSSSLQTNVDIKTHSKSPSPIRSETTVESTWRSSLRNGQAEPTLAKATADFNDQRHRHIDSDSELQQSYHSEYNFESKKSSSNGSNDKGIAGGSTSGSKGHSKYESFPYYCSVRSPSRERRVRISEEQDENGLTKTGYTEYSKKSSRSCSGEDSRREELSTTIDMPIDGWSLKDAIKKKMLNPRTGKSPSRSLSLSRAFDRGILDDSGQYCQAASSSSIRRKLTLEEAIDRKYVTYDPLFPSSDLTATRVIRIVKTDRSCDVSLQPHTSSSRLESPSSDLGFSVQRQRHTSSSASPERPSPSCTSTERSDSKTRYEEYAQVGPNVYYSPASDTVIDETSGERMSLREALDLVRVDHTKFAVIDTETSEPLSLKEATRKGLLDALTYSVRDRKRSKTFDLTEAVKRGLFVLASSPFTLMEAASSAFSTQLTIPSGEMDESDLPSSGGKVVRETVQVLKSREVLIKDPTTGRELSIDEALRRGLLTREKADQLRGGDKDHGFSVERSIDLTVHDPRTGKAIPIEDAVIRGIIDEATASRIRSGQVIENVIKTNVTVVDDESENWTDIVSEINQRLDLIQEFRQFQQVYTKLKRWLNEAEQRIRTLTSSISLERSEIDAQLDTVRTIREEFRGEEGSLREVDETSRSCQSRMDRESIEFARIERLTSSLHTQWDQCLSDLSECESKLKEMRDTSERYFEKIKKVHRELDGIAREMDSLSSYRQESSLKEEKLETIDQKLTKQRAVITECESACDQLCSLLTDSSVRSEVRNGFNEVDRKCRELTRDVREMSSFLKDFHSFQLKADQLETWQKKTESELKSELKITTEERSLMAQVEHTESIYKEMKSKELNFEELIDIGRDVSKQAPSIETYECKLIEKRLNEMEKRWTEIRKSAEQRMSKLEKGLGDCKRIRTQLQKFGSWLDEMEVEVSNLQDLTCHRTLLDKQVSEVRKMKHNMHEREDDYCKLSNISLSCFDTGVAQARDEINSMKKRWEDLNKTIDTRYRSLDKLSHKLVDYENMLRDTKASIACFEEKIQVSNVITTNSIDHRIVDKAKSLVDESETVQRKVSQTQEMASQFCKEVKHGSEEMLSEVTNLGEKFDSLVNSLTTRYSEMKSAYSAMVSLSEKVESFQNQVAKEEISLSKLGSIASDSRTLELQIKQVKEFAEEAEKITQTGEELGQLAAKEATKFEKSFEKSFRHVIHMIESSETSHKSHVKTIAQRKASIEEAMKRAAEYEKELHELEQWLSSTEKEVSKMEEASFLAETIEQQIQENRKLQERVENRQDTLAELERKAPKHEKDLLIAIRHRINKLTSKCSERAKSLDRNLKQAREFLDKWSECLDWLSQAEAAIEANQSIGGDSSKIASMLAEIRSLSREFDSRHSQYENIAKMGRTMRDKSPKADAPVFKRMLDELRSKWTSAYDSCMETQKRLEKARNLSEKFHKSYENLKEWTKRCVITVDHIHGDVDTVQRLIREHSSFQSELRQKNTTLDSLATCSEELMSSVSLEESKRIEKDVNELKESLKHLNTLSGNKEKKLEESLRKAEQLKRDSSRMLSWLGEIETAILRMDTSSIEKLTIERNMTETERYKKEMSREEANRDKTIADGQTILLDCHIDGEAIIRRTIKTIESRWEEVSGKLNVKEQKLQENMQNILRKFDLLQDLLKWLKKTEREMRDIDSQAIPDDTEKIQRAIEQLQEFHREVMKKEHEMDQVAQEYRSEVVGRKSAFKGGFSRIKARDVPVEQINNARAQEVIERWQNLLRTLDDRMSRLRDKKAYYSELEKLRDFDFDEWRKRFLEWINQRKAKLMEFFRKMDHDHDDKVDYDQFMEGFFRSGFPTSRAEMQRVAPIFDRNSDGFIDSKEWIDTLRDKTEAEIIKDEVQKQVAKCMCLSKYKVYQVEDRKYRFGDAQILRLVRILRSTVMVRVGGGWVSLDEFLLKNDPCRARGRTNVELREPLAEGVSQSIAAFRSRPYTSSLGPITKIREKTERSVPMCHSHSHGHEPDSDDSLNATEAETKPTSPMTFEGRTSRSSRLDEENFSEESLEGQQQRRRPRSSSRHRQKRP